MLWSVAVFLSQQSTLKLLGQKAEHFVSS